MIVSGLNPLGRMVVWDTAKPPGWVTMVPAFDLATLERMSKPRNRNKVALAAELAERAAMWEMDVVEQE